MDKVKQVTLSGESAIELGQPTMIITERAVFDFTKEGLVLKEITRIHEIRDNPEVRSVFLLHIPFYLIEFEVKGKRFNAKLDASTGRTVITQIPRKTTYVTQIIVLAALFGITGLAGIFMIVNSIVPAIAGFLTLAGLAYSARIIHMGLRRRYREAAK